MKNVLEGKPEDATKMKTVVTEERKEAPKKDAFQAFNPINCETEGIEIGAIHTEKYEFEEVGDRIVGILVGRQEFNMRDNPILYEVENDAGDFSFWGSTLLNNRLAEVEDGLIIDITYEGLKFSKASGSNYKNYTIKCYPVPPNFDRNKWRVSLSPDGKVIAFVECKESE